MSRSEFLLAFKGLHVSGLLKTRCATNRFLEFCPSQQISQLRLEKVRLRFVACGRGLPPVGNQNYALVSLVFGQSLTFLAQLHDFVRNLNHVPRLFHLVIATLNSYCDFVLKPAHVFFGFGQLRLALAYRRPAFSEVEYFPTEVHPEFTKVVN